MQVKRALVYAVEFHYPCLKKGPIGLDAADVFTPLTN
jgi:hypothetical protein